MAADVRTDAEDFRSKRVSYGRNKLGVSLEKLSGTLSRYQHIATRHMLLFHFHSVINHNRLR